MVALLASPTASMPLLPDLSAKLHASDSTPWTILFVLTLITLLPSILMAMTPLVRLTVVFHFLRQALGTQTAPSNPTLLGLALMMTWFLMTPVLTQVDPYSFASAGQISTEQLRAISMLNDLFARNLTHNLAAWLRTRFQVNLVSAEQIPFNEFMLRIPEISYVASVRLEPLGALSVLQLEMSLAPPVIDLLLGGDGKEGPLRELTDIEESILGSVVETICRELTVAWQPVGLSFSFDRRQMLTQVARVISLNEKTLCLSFEIRMPHASGLLNLAFPAVASNAILRKLTVDWGRGRRHAAETRNQMEERARLIRFGTSLQLPRVRIAARDLEGLQAGALIRLNIPGEARPVWCSGGQVLAAAGAVLVGAHRGARLEDAVSRRSCGGQR